MKLKGEVSFLALLAIASIVLTGMFSQAVLSSPTGQQQDPQTESGNTDQVISVVGRSTISADPDRAEIILGVEEEAADAAVAQKAVADKMARIREALAKLGVGKESIETVSYNIYPRYNWEKFANRIDGYTVTHTIKVKLADLSKVGSVVDAAGDAGANRVDHIAFTLSDEKSIELKRKALTEAGKNARAEADAAAAGLGVRVTKALKISTNNFDYQPYYYGGYALAKTMEAAAPTEIEARSVGVSATVTVEFAFE